MENRRPRFSSQTRVMPTTEMVIQEINRYADSEWRYADSADETAIEEAVRNMQRMAEAKRRFEEGKEGI